MSERTEWGFIFRLSNGARGEATFFNSGSDKLEIGTKIKGKVLNVCMLFLKFFMYVRFFLCPCIFEFCPNLNILYAGRLSSKAC